ncbi:nuclear transport factor 2 family protein [Sphingobacterium sp. HMA12]|uniref:nuclear transport factor 2 family protein n=1 Tax=Sphingobacterium sp. HMA12 TaxID=2050894 RepID=UPI000CEA434E|nr:nuclear transport factor 2 family protein [Sphingobacterium sp. HMA12]
MNTLIKTFAAVALITVSTCTMAADNPGKGLNLSTADLAIDSYVSVMTEGMSGGVEQLFASDFSQKIQGDNGRTNKRSEVISFLKKQKGEKLNCSTKTEILEESENYMVARITMKFETFTKTDLVTLVNESGSWKIASSVNSYK